MEDLPDRCHTKICSKLHFQVDLILSDRPGLERQDVWDDKVNKGESLAVSFFFADNLYDSKDILKTFRRRYRELSSNIRRTIKG
jgi:hypothetical protein